MSTYRSTLNQTTVDELTGIVSFRLRKELVLDDGTVVDLGWHRFCVAPGEDPNQVLATINTHLASNEIQGGPLVAGDMEQVRIRTRQEHSPERVLKRMDHILDELKDITPRDPGVRAALIEMKKQRDALADTIS